jgi:hypothetical protein
MFSEPEELDDTWAPDEESVVSWLERSTLPRAKNIRQFLNELLAAIPTDLQGQFQDNLRHRWNSAFFELVVARTIQLLGGQFEVEITNDKGRRPDFRARFPSQEFVIEAMSPKFDRETADRIVQDTELKRIIERNMPSEWSVLLHRLPKFDPSESRSPLKKVMQGLRDLAPPTHENDLREFTFDLPQGTLAFTLVPRLVGVGNVLSGPAYTSFSDSQQRILYALKKKRNQTRSEKLPVILAIHASGISSSFEDFDTTLFGHTVSRVGADGQELDVYFRPDGLFSRLGIRNSYAGVLAFIHLTPLGMQGPVLYLHPDAEVKDTGWERLERRIVSATGVSCIPAATPRLADEFRFVKPD